MDVREQVVALQAWPVSGPAAQRDVDILSRQIDDARRGVEPHGDLRVLELEGADPRGQPLVGDGGQRGDRQHALVGLAQVGQGGAQDGHGLGRRIREPLARTGQGHLPGQAQEQRLIQPALQRLHLPTDRGLGDPQFLSRAGEALQAGGRLEDPERVERNGSEDVCHKVCLCIQQEHAFVIYRRSTDNPFAEKDVEEPGDGRAAQVA